MESRVHVVYLTGEEEVDNDNINSVIDIGEKGGWELEEVHIIQPSSGSAGGGYNAGVLLEFAKD